MGCFSTKSPADTGLYDLQNDLRDGDLTALTCPVMIVRGTKDAFSTEPKFSEVMQQMSSKNLKIEQVEGGDHSLSTKTKVGQER